MDNTIKKQINLYIEFLSTISTNSFELKSWTPTCIECLQFALDNEQLLEEKPELYQDTLSTLQLLYFWLKDGEEWAYIELSQKFKKHYSPEVIGKAFKEISKRLAKLNNQDDIDKTLEDIGVTLKTPDGNYRNTYDVLNDISQAGDKLK